MLRGFTALPMLIGLLTAVPVVHAADEPPTCGHFGTRVDFMESPKEAAKWAAKHEKLVFVLHVSGVFEDPGLT